MNKLKSYFSTEQSESYNEEIFTEVRPFISIRKLFISDNKYLCIFILLLLILSVSCTTYTGYS